ncbi:protein ANTAGONIST OF LIKE HETEROCHROMATIN PROTEIN 1-like [Selaginella moellendorffii]|uniref:protein ANTAGONIST OF LIKE HETEROCHROMATIN PROTEIN 1-like n=1 Tax=Selaginella moellendorffii TaxID=88036 RepID=UPI000D1C3B13|nr:protein ANTAGONIST OF LIKE HETEROCHROMATIN PROTEIN 1-like [Selaginella moellendorffii]|eukprot:XP_024514868.1 protein ANTAGONIST OF LIKE HETEROCHROMATIN PROTEIN 1-like [Selaginella moellendorffii]
MPRLTDSSLAIISHAVGIVMRPPPGLAEILGQHLPVFALKRLASGDMWRTISDAFGVASCTAQTCLRCFRYALLEHERLMIHWLDEEGMKEVIIGFQRLCGFPNCCGAMDCTHIAIELPGSEDATDWYVGAKKYYSMVVQAVVDSKTSFLDITTEIAGSVPDRRVWNSSGLKKAWIEKKRLCGSVYHTEFGDISQYIIADGGYDCALPVLVPYPNRFHGKEQYNFLHSSMRIVVKRSFGILKRQWKLLAWKGFRGHLGILANNIIACCVLHNLMITQNDRFMEDFDPDKFNHDAGYLPQRSLRSAKDGIALRDTVENKPAAQKNGDHNNGDALSRRWFMSSSL